MTKAKQYIKSVKKLAISVDDIARYMSPNGSELPDLFIDIASVELKKIKDYKVNFGYEIYTSKIYTDTIRVENTELNVGKYTSKVLTNSEYLALFACTVGNELEEYFREKQYQNDMTEAYISDIIGTLIVEKTLGQLTDCVKDLAKTNSLKITNTQSPGNCGWDIKDQKKLFQLLPKKYLGISLNESGMMHPSKSISGVIGIGENVKFKHTNCKSCPSANCMYRKVPFDTLQINS